MHRFDFPGWLLLGAFPDPEDDGVGSWLLHHGGDAMLLEVPPGVSPGDVSAGLAAVGGTLRYATASHDHEDHFDPDVWAALRAAFPAAEFIPPAARQGTRRYALGGEPVYRVAAPKHSRTDAVTVFRGVAMTGDIELGRLPSVNREVAARDKARSMDYYRDFPDRTGYHVHTVVSAHLNDVRRGVDWRRLFEYRS